MIVRNGKHRRRAVLTAFCISGLNREQDAKVVYRYNHSKHDVNTILKIADLLKG